MQTTRLGILCINIKRESLLINIKRSNLTLWNWTTPQTVAKSAEETEQTRKNVSIQITVHIFCIFSNGMASTIWFPKCNSWFPHRNVKCPLFNWKAEKTGKESAKGTMWNGERRETALFSLPIVPHAKLFLKFYLKCYRWDTSTSLCGGENSM